MGLTVGAQPHSDTTQWAAIMAMSGLAYGACGHVLCALPALLHCYFIEGPVLSGMKA